MSQLAGRLLSAWPPQAEVALGPSLDNDLLGSSSAFLSTHPRVQTMLVHTLTGRHTHPHAAWWVPGPRTLGHHPSSN